MYFVKAAMRNIFLGGSHPRFSSMASPINAIDFEPVRSKTIKKNVFSCDYVTLGLLVIKIKLVAFFLIAKYGVTLKIGFGSRQI